MAGRLSFYFIISIFLCAFGICSSLATAEVPRVNKPWQEAVRKIISKKLPAFLPRPSIEGLRYLAMGYALEEAEHAGVHISGEESIQDILDAIALKRVLASILKSEKVSTSHVGKIWEEITNGNMVLVGIEDYRVVSYKDIVELQSSKQAIENVFVISWESSTGQDPDKILLLKIRPPNEEGEVSVTSKHVAINTSIFPNDSLSLAAIEVAMRNISDKEKIKIKALLGDNWRDYLFYILSRVELLPEVSIESITGGEYSHEKHIAEYIKGLLDYSDYYSLDNVNNKPQYGLGELELRDILESTLQALIVPASSVQVEKKAIEEKNMQSFLKKHKPNPGVDTIVVEIEQTLGVDNLHDWVNSEIKSQGMDELLTELTPGENSFWTEKTVSSVTELLKVTDHPHKEYLEGLAGLLVEAEHSRRMALDSKRITVAENGNREESGDELQIISPERANEGREIVREVMAEFEKKFGVGFKNAFTTDFFLKELVKLGGVNANGTKHDKVEINGISISGITRTSRANGSEILVGRKIPLIKEARSAVLKGRLLEAGLDLDDLIAYSKNAEYDFFNKQEKDVLVFAKGFLTKKSGNLN